MSDREPTRALHQALRSGLAYGLGLVLGQTLGFLVADRVSLVASPDQASGTNFLLAGILLSFTFNDFTWPEFSWQVDRLKDATQSLTVAVLCFTGFVV